MAHDDRPAVPFRPALRMLAPQPSTLQPPDLSAAAVFAHFPGLRAAAAVCLTGSVAAGWGNPYSDIDLFAFSDAPLVLPEDETTEVWDSEDGGLRWTTWMGRFGDTRVDLKIWPTDTPQKLLEPFAVVPEPEFSDAGEFVEEFLYRLVIGRALSGEDFLRDQIAAVHASSYQRALARLLKLTAENCLTDVAGQLDAGDVSSARISAVRAAELAADAALVLAGELCRRDKWLLRRLQSTPAAGIDAEELSAVVLDGPARGEALDSYSLRVARWAQRELIRTEDAILTTRRAGDHASAR